MAEDGDQGQNGIRIAILALLKKEVRKEDLVVFLESVVDDLDLDDKTLFAIGESLTAKAFATAARNPQIDHAEKLCDIVSDIAQKRTMSPKDDRPAHILFSMDRDVDGSEAKHQFLQRARRLIPGIDEHGGLGGYVCLADMSHCKSEQTDVWAVYNPAALGLAFTVNKASLYEHVLFGRVRLERVEGHGYDAPDSLRVCVSNPGSRILVRIERGTVFERRSTDDIQNLLVRDEVVVELDSGTHELAVFGMCMDQNASPPSGQSMSLTPWILRPKMDNQQALWRFMVQEEGESAAEAKHEYELLGESYKAKNQKDAFVSIFKELSDRDDDFLEKMSELSEYGGTSVVARDRTDLPDGAQETAVEIGDGYWLQTKLDKERKLRKLKEACEVVGIVFGEANGLRIEF